MRRTSVLNTSRSALLVALAATMQSALAIDPEAPYYEQILQALVEHPTRDQVLPWEPEGVHGTGLMFNREAPVPPQCYTDSGSEHNPCYVCHQNNIPGRENKQNDRQLQEAYSFSDEGLTNHWSNLFEDRSARVNAISDAQILDWIDDDNYSELAGRLQAAGFTGWIPDLDNLEEAAAAFDQYGLALDGSWWVAFSYKPLPSTFWPTSGATDDVMIRLAPPFWKLADGSDSVDLYRANLALVEANIKGRTRMGSLPIDEVAINIDVNDDGQLDSGVTEVVITANRQSGSSGTFNYYLGMAQMYDIIPSIFPVGTEFLHTVRYVGVDAAGNISNARRMKEVRYMKRYIQSRQFQLDHWYEEEALDKEQGLLPHWDDHGHNGLAKAFGWEVTGFIEAYDGRLRWNTFEENAFCMGCHSSVGSTIDKTFSFGRKRDGAAGWSYINLKGMPEVPNMGETQGEVFTYLQRVGGGSEFRSNPELEARFYLADGVTLNTVAVASAKDVYDLITPSRERALALNKAYKVIVEDQDFIFGRDATATPPQRVLPMVDNETSPTLPPERQFDWDIVPDWSQVSGSGCMYNGDVDFAQLSSAHTIHIGGTAAEDFDQVCAGGSVALAGDLVVSLEAGFQPQVGDSFTLVKAVNGLTGGFQSVQLPVAANGVFQVSQTANELRVTLVAASTGSDEDIPIPLPWLIVLAMALIGIGTSPSDRRRSTAGSSR